LVPALSPLLGMDRGFDLRMKQRRGIKFRQGTQQPRNLVVTEVNWPTFVHQFLRLIATDGLPPPSLHSLLARPTSLLGKAITDLIILNEELSLLLSLFVYFTHNPRVRARGVQE